ncbi:DUF4386 domain-containing protein [Salinibacterium sp. ZJ77]|uniref:DUF4386 domain-containing protein n=1 Tax=Salinibacterium sp. ZJ77 TaxID=2708337 RepID=UPI00141E2F69|nr:DUF4386 domain-containing protein [Salinibacterium sp. ZJ77]
MSHDIRIARLTGVAYLSLALVGMAGFLVVRPRLEVAGDPAATLALRAENPALAHLGIALELLIVIAQAAAALGFVALLRDRPAAAFGVASFGIANALTILGSAGLLVGAQRVIDDPSLAPGGDAAATAALLVTLSAVAWKVGAVFFGLWLIPMGWFALSTRRMPRVMGWFLVVGGAGYVLSAIVAVSVPAIPAAVADALTLPATVGELWAVGYLLFVGIRPAPSALASAHTTRAGEAVTQR